MKTAIYIEDGRVQLVLTPTNAFERDALRAFEAEGAVDATIQHGEFYDCRGGWTRHGGASSDRSLILQARPKAAGGGDG